MPKFYCVMYALIALILSVNVQAESPRDNGGIPDAFQSREGFTSADIVTSGMQAIKG
ncbi:MAG: hypothetical protein KUG80_02725 [Gammaproteobacteria bacterium]|nr:hypothetical protein [Gammaproteobacteria bacterium]